MFDVLSRTNDGQRNHRFQFTLSDLFLATFFVALGSCGFAWYLRLPLDTATQSSAYASAGLIGVGIGIVIHRVVPCAYLGVISFFFYSIIWQATDPPFVGPLIALVIAIIWQLNSRSGKRHNAIRLGSLAAMSGLLGLFTAMKLGVDRPVSATVGFVFGSRTFAHVFNIVSGIAFAVGLVVVLVAIVTIPPSARQPPDDASKSP